MNNHTVINSNSSFSDAKSTVVRAAEPSIQTALRGGYSSSTAASSNSTVVNAVSPVGFDMTGETVLDRYKVTRKLDIPSGEADLYLCDDLADGGEFILKLYRRLDAVKETLLEQLAKIRSDSIGSVLGYGRFRDFPFVILTYFRNGSLQGKRFSADELKENIIPSILDGLKVLHENNIIHKDIKPSNIMLKEDGKSVAIIDFGISSIVEDGQTMLVTRTGMSPVYSAPETFNNVFFCESDYYSLGITIYELYTGHTPYENLAVEDMAAFASVQKIPFADDFSPELKLLIQGLTYKDLSNRGDPDNPNRRWTSREVEKWLAGDELPVPGAMSQVSGDFTKSFSFMGKELTTVDEIVSEFGRNWKQGKVNVGRGLLSDFFRDISREDYYNLSKDCEEAGVSDSEFFKLLLKLSPDRSVFYWQGDVFESMEALAKAILEQEIQGSTSFANDEFLWSLRTFYENEADVISVLERIYEKINSGCQKDRHHAMLNVAFLLGSLFLVDGKIFRSSQEVADHFAAIRSRSHQEFFESLLKNYDDISEYIKLQDHDKDLKALFDVNVLDLVLNYPTLITAGYSPETLRRFGIFVVDSDIKKFSDLYRHASLGSINVRVLYFRVSPPENFFITDDEPHGPQEVHSELIVLDPSVRSLAKMFSGCSKLKKAPSFNTAAVDDMYCMFKGCSSLVTVPRYKTSAVTNMNQMFDGCSSLEEVPCFDTSKVKNVGMMFNNCHSLLSVPEFNLSSAVNFVLMFSRCSKLVSVSNMNTPQAEDMNYMFSGCSSLIYAPELDMSTVMSANGMYLGCSSVRNIPAMNLKLARKLSLMFKNCISLTLLPKLDMASDVDDFSEMFYGCSNLEKAPDIDTSSAINMENMFNGCARLVTVPRYNTRSVSNMKGMFAGCSKLREIPAFDTSSVTDMQGMFQDCSSLFHVPDLNTAAVENMSRMFYGCTSIRKIPHFDTSGVKHMDYVFANCSSLKRIPKFNMKNVLDKNGMYDGSGIPNSIFRYESTIYIVLASVGGILVLVALTMLYFAFFAG